MKITVFGATGGIGGHVVRQALDAGHKVAAVVRASSSYDVEHPSLEVFRVPGLTEAEPLLDAVDGSDAVISGVGPRGRKDGPVASGSTRSILAAMSAHGVRRFVAVSAAPFLDTNLRNRYRRSFERGDTQNPSSRRRRSSIRASTF